MGSQFFKFEHKYKTHIKNIKKKHIMFYEPIYLDIDLSHSQPVVRQSCKRDGSRCSSPSQVCVNLAGFKSDNIQVNAEKSGRVTVNASKDKVEDSGRNGQRKTTVHVEQQLDLSEYVVKEGLMEKVSTKFENGRLCFQLPQKPVGTRIPINFEGVEDKKSQETVEVEMVKMVDTDGDTEINVE